MILAIKLLSYFLLNCLMQCKQKYKKNKYKNWIQSKRTQCDVKVEIIVSKSSHTEVTFD